MKHLLFFVLDIISSKTEKQEQSHFCTHMTHGLNTVRNFVLLGLVSLDFLHILKLHGKSTWSFV